PRQAIYVRPCSFPRDRRFCAKICFQEFCAGKKLLCPLSREKVTIEQHTPLAAISHTIEASICSIEVSAQSRSWSAETTVDQASIRGLDAAFRVPARGQSRV